MNCAVFLFESLIVEVDSSFLMMGLLFWFCSIQNMRRVVGKERRIKLAQLIAQ